VGEMEALTGHPVRSRYKLPWEKDALPKVDAMLVAPLSCTSLNKWAAGITDTVALGIPSEAVHMGVPVAVMPFFNQAQARAACHGPQCRDAARARRAGAAGR
jgi:flavoprotein